MLRALLPHFSAGAKNESLSPPTYMIRNGSTMKTTDPFTKDAPKRLIQWADGIRGIACLSVTIGHTFSGLYVPSDAFDRPNYFLTLPIVRLLLESGYLAVCIFFVMSGYVCSMKPLKLARTGKPDAASAVIASSALRRLFRLAPPALLATTISWLLDQFGGFNLARSLHYCWFQFFSPAESPSFWDGLVKLFHSFLRTWYYDGVVWYTDRNLYEAVQWTLAYELRGSMMVYLTLLATVNLTSFYRRSVFVLLTLYSFYCDNDVLLNIPFSAGVILADISLTVSDRDYSTPFFTLNLRRESIEAYIKSHWPIFLAIFGLFIGSFPTDSFEKAAWSRFIFFLGTPFLRPDWEAPWAFTLIGAIIIIFAIQFSPTLRNALSTPFAVFLGTISFPLYLIHSILLRTVLVWIIYGLIPESGGLVRRGAELDGETIEKSILWTLVTAVAIGLWFGLLIFLSTLWRDRLDGLFVQFSKWAEDVLCGKKPLFNTVGGIHKSWNKSDEGDKLSNGHSHV